MYLSETASYLDKNKPRWCSLSFDVEVFHVFTSLSRHPFSLKESSKMPSLSNVPFYRFPLGMYPSGVCSFLNQWFFRDLRRGPTAHGYWAQTYVDKRTGTLVKEISEDPDYDMPVLLATFMAWDHTIHFYGMGAQLSTVSGLALITFLAWECHWPTLKECFQFLQ